MSLIGDHQYTLCEYIDSQHSFNNVIEMQIYTKLDDDIYNIPFCFLIYLLNTNIRFFDK